MSDDRRDRISGDHNRRTRRRESPDTPNSSNTRVEDNTNVDTGKSKSRWSLKRWGRNKGTRKRTDASRSARATESSHTIEVQTEKEKLPRKMPVCFLNLFVSISIELFHHSYQLKRSSSSMKHINCG